VERPVLGLEPPERLTHTSMRLAEGDAREGGRLREVGREQPRLARGVPHRVPVERRDHDAAGERRVERVERDREDLVPAVREPPDRGRRVESSRVGEGHARHADASPARRGTPDPGAPRAR
jgi:hypothetical protein